MSFIELPLYGVLIEMNRESKSYKEAWLTVIKKPKICVRRFPVNLIHIVTRSVIFFTLLEQW